MQNSAWAWTTALTSWIARVWKFELQIIYTTWKVQFTTPVCKCHLFSSYQTHRIWFEHWAKWVSRKPRRKPCVAYLHPRQAVVLWVQPADFQLKKLSQMPQAKKPMVGMFSDSWLTWVINQRKGQENTGQVCLMHDANQNCLTIIQYPMFP